MSIKKILRLGVALSLVIISILAGWIFFITNNYNETTRSADIAQKVNSAISKLTILSSDYLLYSEPRVSFQWKISHSQLSEILNSLEINNLNELIDLNLLRKTHARSLRLFERIEAVKEGADKNNKLLIAQRKALSAQLLATSQLKSKIATQLANIIELNRKTLEEQLFFLALIIFVIFIITLLPSWYLIASRIVIPVENLRKHISNIDAEHLNEKHLVRRNDEVGALINSFNTMAENLFNTTVSKEKLKNEIKERKKSEKELRKQQDLNISVLEGADNIIIILDSHGNIIHFNRSAEDLTGYHREEVVGHPIWETVIPKEEQNDVMEVFNALMTNSIDITGYHENHWVTKSGEYRLIEWHNTVIQEANNEITHIVAMGYDITEKRFNEVEKRRVERELNQSRKMEALGKLTGGIAHDFNNMLGIIIGYTDLALEHSLNKKDSTFINYLEQIQTASNRAKSLIAKMLAFSRADQADSYSLQLAPLLDENITLMKSVLPSTIQIEVEKESDVPNIDMDPVQFQQMLMNLMINARDAMNGVGNIKVSLGRYKLLDKECSSCHQKIVGDWVEIMLADNGSGMTKDVKDRIFDPFFSTKELGEGAGMGLSVLHGIVKGHGGHIIVDSTLGKGTSFYLLFHPSEGSVAPVKKVLIEKTAVLEGSGQRILIIDDQETLADVQYELLNSYGYNCTKKYDSEEALSLYLSDTSAFDLILTDQTMPKLTGLQLIDVIRNKGLTIPVIITTGYSEITVDKLEIENVILLNKPVDTNNLLDNIAQILHSSVSG